MPAPETESGKEKTIKSQKRFLRDPVGDGRIGRGSYKPAQSGVCVVTITGRSRMAPVWLSFGPSRKRKSLPGSYLSALTSRCSDQRVNIGTQIRDPGLFGYSACMRYVLPRISVHPPGRLRLPSLTFHWGQCSYMVFYSLNVSFICLPVRRVSFIVIS